MSSDKPQSAGNSPRANMNQPRWNAPEAQIKETAYYIWEKEGRPGGHAMDHWLRAESEVRTLRDAGPIRDQNS